MEESWKPRLENRLGCNLHGHHLVAVDVEEVPPVARPDGFIAPLGGNRPLSSRPRERSYVNLSTARLLGHIGQPAAVRRKAWDAFIKGSFQKNVWRAVSVWSQ